MAQAIYRTSTASTSQESFYRSRSGAPFKTSLGLLKIFCVSSYLSDFCARSPRRRSMVIAFLLWSGARSRSSAVMDHREFLRHIHDKEVLTDGIPETPALHEKTGAAAQVQCSTSVLRDFR
jgi:hypothetical protein